MSEAFEKWFKSTGLSAEQEEACCMAWAARGKWEADGTYTVPIAVRPFKKPELKPILDPVGTQLLLASLLEELAEFAGSDSEFHHRFMALRDNVAWRS